MWRIGVSMRGILRRGGIGLQRGGALCEMQVV
jgi:hypothetical protein